MMRRNVIFIVIMIICYISIVGYGRQSIQNVEVESNPDLALESYPEMEVMYAPADSDYFINNPSCTLADIEAAADIVVKIKVCDDRVMSLRTTQSLIQIEEIFYDPFEELSINDEIYIIEPVSFIRGDSFYTGGWNYMQTGQEYIVYLKHLECIEGYEYTDQEQISYMPVSELYAKYNVNEVEVVEVLQDKENLIYKEVQNYAFLSEDIECVDTYNKIQEQIMEKFQN